LSNNILLGAVLFGNALLGFEQADASNGGELVLHVRDLPFAKSVLGNRVGLIKDTDRFIPIKDPEGREIIIETGQPP
jgi:hypothetical protein